MANPTAPEPPDDDDTSGPADPGSRVDLSAIPSFLRSRAGADEAGDDAPAPVRVVRQLGPALAAAPDPAALRMAGVSPRRMLQVVAIIAVAWGVVSFGRQVASASDASAHAATLRAANSQLQVQVAAMQHEIAPAGREAVELSLDAGDSIGRVAAVRHVPVRPHDVLAVRSPSGVGQRRLRDDHERAIRQAALRCSPLGRRHVAPLTAEVHRSRHATRAGGPGHRPGQHEIELGRGDTVPPGAGRPADQRRSLAGGEVEQHGSCGR